MANNYAGMRRSLKADGEAARCAERLLAMRKTLADVRKRRSDSSLLLATWNIRDFDSNKFGWGPRLPETYYYIAEMISCFDLVAIQEVNDSLAPLETVIRILGREWDYIVTDVTTGASGNGERMAFVYNTEKVWFRKVAGEIVLPDGQLIVSQKKQKKKDQPDVEPETEEMRQQFARSPFMVAFQSGWFRFSLCTVHIYYGGASGAKLERRISEIKALVKFFADRQDDQVKAAREIGLSDGNRSVENVILLGDFNVVSPEHRTMEALQAKGFKVPAEIDGDVVRDDEDHFYDQIAVRVKDPRFKVLGGGMLDLFTDVFRDEDRKVYASSVPKKDPDAKSKKPKTPEQLYKSWRTWQMSDHSPLWIEIATDFSDEYLEEIVRG